MNERLREEVRGKNEEGRAGDTLSNLFILPSNLFIHPLSM
jgi:hypothetical protein